MQAVVLAFAVWLGTFVPAAPAPRCADCKAARVVATSGVVQLLPPADGAAPDAGDVAIASPLVGLVVRGKLDHGKVALPWFAVDTRDSALGVIVLPADVVVRFVVPTPADVLGIKDALARDDALSVGRRDLVMHALKDLEIGALDVDGDGKADVAATYGCTSWGDGSCQERGQFFLVRRGQRWVEIE